MERLTEGSSACILPSQEQLYEGVIPVVARWVVERARRDRRFDPLGEETQEEHRAVWLDERRVKPGAISYQEDIPYYWVETPGKNPAGAEILVPLSPAGHLLLANQELPAARGLIKTIPGLRELIVKQGMKEEDALPAIQGAALAALIRVENAYLADPFADMTLAESIAFWGLAAVACVFVGASSLVANALEKLTGKKIWWKKWQLEKK